MTPLPKRRTSTQRKGKRRATIKLVLPKIITCKHCGVLKKSHIRCHNCKK